MADDECKPMVEGCTVNVQYEPHPDPQINAHLRRWAFNPICRLIDNKGYTVAFRYKQDDPGRLGVVDCCTAGPFRSTRHTRFPLVDGPSISVALKTLNEGFPSMI